MSLLSFLSKPSPEDIYQELASKIVLFSLKYREEINEPNSKLSADAGAEIAYFLLHLVDRNASQLCGLSKGDEIFDQIAKRTFADYSLAVIKSNAPKDIISKLVMQMMDDFNDRQIIYSQCDSFLRDSLPSKGTMMFALSFFIYRALKKTDRYDVDDILCGKREITKAENDDFPDFEQSMYDTIKVGNYINALQIPKILKKLKCANI